MRKSRYQFGTGCIDNVFEFLKIQEKPKRKTRRFVNNRGEYCRRDKERSKFYK